jgi:hypothetical protein
MLRVTAFDAAEQISSAAQQTAGGTLLQLQFAYDRTTHRYVLSIARRRLRMKVIYRYSARHGHHPPPDSAHGHHAVRL